MRFEISLPLKPHTDIYYEISFGTALEIVVSWTAYEKRNNLKRKIIATK